MVLPNMDRKHGISNKGRRGYPTKTNSSSFLEDKVGKYKIIGYRIMGKIKIVDVLMIICLLITFISSIISCNL